MRRVRLTRYILFAAFILLPTTACALDRSLVDPNQGYVKLFCSENPCVPMTGHFWRDLQAHHRATNSLIEPVNVGDMDWSVHEERKEGNCNNFATTIQAMLKEQYPRYVDSFKLAEVFTETGDRHVVLTVDTTIGMFICDIRMPSCVMQSGLPQYTWIKRQVAGLRWENAQPQYNASGTP